MTVSNADFARRPLNEVIDSDHLNLRCAMVLHRFIIMPPFSRLAHYIIMLFLSKHLLKLLNLALFKIQLFLIVVFQLYFNRPPLLLEDDLKLLVLLLKVVDFLLQDLDVKFELLFDFNVVSDFGLVDLQLGLVFLRGEV